MKDFWIVAGVGLLCPMVCTAQLASPQWRQPGVDSTHVTGNAARVLPEYFVKDPDATVSPTPVEHAPTNVAELLAAFEGVTLAVPGTGQGASGQIRLVVSAGRAQVQTTLLWNWYETCAATAATPNCRAEDYLFRLSPEGVLVSLVGCGAGFYGVAGGSAEFKWSDFVAFGGLSASTKSWGFQRSDFWKSCTADSGPNS